MSKEEALSYISTTAERENCGHDVEMYVNLAKDFRTLGLKTDKVPEQFGCCFECGADHMNLFNIALKGINNHCWTAESVRKSIEENAAPLRLNIDEP
jgi:hypothetical protein